MKWDQLECFLKLSETLSFSETAVLMGLTQPSVTRKIQALEESLKCSLFVRSKHSVKLSSDGRQLLKKIKPLHQEFTTVLSRARDSQSSLSGVIRVGILNEVGKNYFCREFLKFQTKNPDVRLQVSLALNHENLPKLLEGELDFAIVNQLPPHELYRSYKLMEEKAVMVTTPENKSFKGPIEKQPFVAYSPHDGLLNDYLKTFYRPLDISKIENISAVNDHQSMIQMILATDAIAVMPWFAIESHLQSGKLVRMDSHSKTSAFYLVELNQNWRSKKEQAFRSFLLSLKTK